MLDGFANTAALSALSVAAKAAAITAAKNSAIAATASARSAPVASAQANAAAAAVSAAVAKLTEAAAATERLELAKQANEWGRKIIEVYMTRYAVFLTANIATIGWLFGSESKPKNNVASRDRFDNSSLQAICILFVLLDVLGIISTGVVARTVAPNAGAYQGLIVCGGIANGLGLFCLIVAWVYFLVRLSKPVARTVLERDTTERCPNSSYILGFFKEELVRIEVPAAFFADSTKAFLLRAGLAKGMRVLDVGIGSVAFLAAEIVGKDGSVVGVDVWPEAIEKAKQKTTTLALTGCIPTFEVGDPSSFVTDGKYDAVIGRLILTHYPNQRRLSPQY